MVPEAGLEPAHLAAGDFESPASTNSATRATQKFPNYRKQSRQWLKWKFDEINPIKDLFVNLHVRLKD